MGNIYFRVNKVQIHSEGNSDSFRKEFRFVPEEIQKQTRFTKIGFKCPEEWSIKFIFIPKEIPIGEFWYNIQIESERNSDPGKFHSISIPNRI